ALVGVADCKDVLFISGELLENFNLYVVGILEFVHQDESGPLALPFQQGWVLLQKPVSTKDLMPKCPQVPLAQHALDRLEDERNLAAAAHRLFVCDLVRIL